MEIAISDKDNQFNNSTEDDKTAGTFDVGQIHNSQNLKSNTVASNQSGTLKISNKKKSTSKKLKHQPLNTQLNTSLDHPSGFKSTAAID